jgi:putative component of toxin-antitoxin plasmid stabilization module
MITIKEYIDAKGRNPYAKWFNRLNAPAAARVVTALVRMEQLENRVDFGPGYRIYFGRDGDQIVILLGGGTKKRQQKDIEAARILWKEYKRRKRQEES